MLKIKNKSYIVFLILGIIGAPLMLSMIPFVSLIGCLMVIIFIPSIFTATFTKERFVHSGYTILSNGEKYHFSIIKVSTHHSFILIPFFTLFYFVPVKRKYILVHHFGADNLKRGAKLPNSYCDPEGVLDSEYISKDTVNKLMKNPQSFSVTFQQRLEKNRADFHVIAPLIKEALNITEVISTTNYTILSNDKYFLLFPYIGNDKKQLAIKLHREYYENYKGDLLYDFLRSILSYNKERLLNSLLIFKYDAISRLLYSNDLQLNKAKNEDPEAAALLDEKIKKREFTLKTDFSKNDTEKVLITNEILASLFDVKVSKSGTVAKRICYAGSAILAIYGVITLFLSIMSAIVFLAFAVILYSVAKKQKEQTDITPKKGTISDFRVVKTICVDYENDEHSSAAYKYVFINGEMIESAHPYIMLDTASTCYIVYSTEDGTIREIYSNEAFIMAPDVKYEDQTS